MGGALGQLVFLVPDADLEAERLRQLGAEILMGPLDRRWGHRTVHTIDPGAAA